MHFSRLEAIRASFDETRLQQDILKLNERLRELGAGGVGLDDEREDEHAMGEDTLLTLTKSSGRSRAEESMFSPSFAGGSTQQAEFEFKRSSSNSDSSRSSEASEPLESPQTPSSKSSHSPLAEVDGDLPQGSGSSLARNKGRPAREPVHILKQLAFVPPSEMKPSDVMAMEAIVARSMLDDDLQFHEVPLPGNRRDIKNLNEVLAHVKTYGDEIPSIKDIFPPPFEDLELIEEEFCYGILKAAGKGISGLISITELASKVGKGTPYYKRFGAWAEWLLADGCVRFKSFDRKKQGALGLEELRRAAAVWVAKGGRLPPE